MNETRMAALFAPQGIPLAQGQIMRRPLLGSTLELVAEQGSAALYTGPIAQGIVDTVQNNSFFRGILTMEDLANYRTTVGQPESAQYTAGTGERFQVYSIPPPASGGVLLMALNILEGYNLTCDGTNQKELEWSTVSVHRLVEAMKFSYAERTKLADPCCGGGGGVAEVCNNQTLCAAVGAATTTMLSKAIAATLRAKIRDNETHLDPAWYAVPDPATGEEGKVYAQPSTPGTTHISVIDGANNQAVAVTSTVNLNFGAKIMTEQGIILNNEMDDFSSPGALHAIQPLPQGRVGGNAQKTCTL